MRVRSYSARAADLQQQLVVRILAHRPVQKLDLAALLLELFEQHHLMDVIARQTVGGRQHQPVDKTLPDSVPQPIQAGAVQPCAAVAVIAENQRGVECDARSLKVGSQAVQLLLNGLLVDLVLGRHPRIHGNSHHLASPVRVGAEGPPDNGSIPTTTGRLGPNAAGRPAAASSADECAIEVS